MKDHLKKLKEIAKLLKGKAKPLGAWIRSKFNTVAVPGWAMVLFMACFCECLMHIWIADELSLGHGRTPRLDGESRL